MTTTRSRPARSHWTDDDLALLWRLHGTTSWAALGARLGRSGRAVRHKFLKLIREGCGGGPSTRRDPRLDAELRRLHAEGRNDPEIGRALGRSAASIAWHRARLGLPAIPQPVYCVPAADRALVIELAGGGGHPARADRVARAFRARTGRTIGLSTVLQIVQEAEFAWDGQPKDHDEVMRRAHEILEKYPRGDGSRPWAVPGVRYREDRHRVPGEGGS